MVRSFWRSLTSAVKNVVIKRPDAFTFFHVISRPLGLYISVDKQRLSQVSALITASMEGRMLTCDTSIFGSLSNLSNDREFQHKECNISHQHRRPDPSTPLCAKPYRGCQSYRGTHHDSQLGRVHGPSVEIPCSDN